MSWYRTGTVSVTNGSTTVTGTTTGWLSQVRAEDRISFNGGDKWYEVASVASNTSLTLATAFAETTISGGAYAIDRSSRVWDQTSNVASQIRTLLASVTNILQGTGAPSNSLGADGDVYFRTDVLTFYGPKAAGAWPAGVSMIGTGLAIANNLSDVASAIASFDNLNKRGADIASASTINLQTATGAMVDVTGTTAITAITLADGQERQVRFTGILTLTHGANLVLPTAANITTAAGDFATLRGYASGVVRCVDYTRASGAALVGGSGGGTNPNLLVNSDFQLNQRAFAGGALSAGAFGFDRWKADSAGANMSVSGYVVTLTSGTIVQVIESAFWGVANHASMQFTVSVDTPADNLTITVGTATGTITAGSGWRTVTITTNSGDTGNIPFKITKASGSGSTTFGRVKLEVGAAATAWQHRSAASEQVLADRYYQRYGGLGATDLQYRAYASGYLQTSLYWRVPLRAAPTVTIAGTWGVLNCGQPFISPATARSGRLQAAVTSSPGDTYFYTNDSSNYIEVSAEL
tara:strand:- start:7024 stop:8595 length:1572 start_codon:yes stop_codon:yes gene_type:complete